MVQGAYRLLFLREEINMQSDQVLPQDIQIPLSEDFIATFGCEYSTKDDLFQQYVFQDNHGGVVKLTFGFVDGSFGLSFFQDDLEILKIYDEFLSTASINETDQSVVIVLKQGNTLRAIKFTVWPRMLVSIDNMK